MQASALLLDCGVLRMWTHKQAKVFFPIDAVSLLLLDCNPENTLVEELWSDVARRCKACLVCTPTNLATQKNATILMCYQMHG